MKYIRVFALIAIILFLDIQSCFTVYAAAPNLPPTLQLVEPEFKVIKGNAYQYALERLGYDIQFGTNALEVWSAVEAACKGIDYAFQDVSDYTSTIQHVQDKSGLPEEWQGINMEVYFAKIDYLDMQIGMYLDEAGKKLGNTMIQYKQEAQTMLERCISGIKNNVLGKIDMAEYDFNPAQIVQDGLTFGGINSFSCDYYTRSFSSDKYKVFRMQVLKSYPENQFFIATWPGYETLFCIGLPGRVPSIKVVSQQFDDVSKLQSILNGGTTYNMFLKYDGIYVNSPLVMNNGYCLYYYTDLSSRGNSYNINEEHYNPFPVINMSETEFTNWFKNQYVINMEPGKLVRGAINLNPNANAQSMPQPDQAYDYDAMVNHNGDVSETVPKLNPNPGLKPLPNAPAYPPVSPTLPGLDPLPNPMPDYKPLPEPEPVPDPEPDPKPDPNPDPGFVAAPISGLMDKFPFCIPFDLIEAFKSLVATSAVPKWEFTITIPGTSYSADLVIDLAPFESVARLSRVLLLLMFIIVLIVATRRLISN